MKTYIEKCKEGIIELNEKTLNEFIEFWNKSDQTRNITLYEAIGLSKLEYGHNTLESKEIIKLLKNKFYFSSI